MLTSGDKKQAKRNAVCSVDIQLEANSIISNLHTTEVRALSGNTDSSVCENIRTHSRMKGLSSKAVRFSPRKVASRKTARMERKALAERTSKGKLRLSVFVVTSLASRLGSNYFIMDFFHSLSRGMEPQLI
jgi:hypothetical protein